MINNLNPNTIEFSMVFKEGNTPWNKDKKCPQLAYWKGKKMKPFTEQHKKNIGLANKGTKRPDLALRNKTKAQRGAVSKAMKGRKVTWAKSGEEHPNWKGDDVGYAGLHKWIRKNKPKPELCENCKQRIPKQIHNIDGEYKRDISDYMWVCVSCHSKLDEKIKNIHGVID